MTKFFVSNLSRNKTSKKWPKRISETTSLVANSKGSRLLVQRGYRNILLDTFFGTPCLLALVVVLITALAPKALEDSPRVETSGEGTIGEEISEETLEEETLEEESLVECFYVTPSTTFSSLPDSISCSCSGAAATFKVFFIKQARDEKPNKYPEFL